MTHTTYFGMFYSFSDKIKKEQTMAVDIEYYQATIGLTNLNSVPENQILPIPWVTLFCFVLKYFAVAYYTFITSVSWLQRPYKAVHNA